jgi:hypothetical protein
MNMGHLSKSRMQQLARSRLIPRYLERIKPPICAACLHGKATKTPWRTKADPRRAPRVATTPGECIVVDQLESSKPGFIGQLRGSILTKLRYRYATVFVDMYSDYTFIYLHTNITSEETIKAKIAFENHADTFGVKIRQYHADNGRFQDVDFKKDCENKGQILSFCGVNAHFQNGWAEKNIWDLQDATRTSLLHAIKKWPSAITIHLWPYAMRYVNDVNNSIPMQGKDNSPIELFSSTVKKLPLRQFYHFGCPVYVLDANLQAGITSWNEVEE